MTGERAREDGNRDDGIRADVELHDGTVTLGHPADIGVGGVSCRCGVLKFSDCTGSHYVTMQAECPACGEVVEVIPVVPLSDGRP